MASNKQSPGLASILISSTRIDIRYEFASRPDVRRGRLPAAALVLRHSEAHVPDWRTPDSGTPAGTTKIARHHGRIYFGRLQGRTDRSHLQGWITVGPDAPLCT